MDAGLIVAIIVGSAVWTYFSIKNTDGPLERAFMVKAAAIAWVAIVVFIVLLLILPQPYNYLMWIPYSTLLPLSIAKCNKRRAELRNRESGT